VKILVLYIKKYPSFKAAGTIYNRAYDKGFIGINEKFEIILSPSFKKNKEEYHAKYFAPLTGTKIIMPKKYYPKKEFLQFHLDEVFKS